MSKSGQSNLKGISAQGWAALSLFLQYLKDPNFSHIHLESSAGEDFDLVFKNGKKVICESKDWNRNIAHCDLKKILHNIISKKSINREDEILIVCTKLSDSLKRDIEKFKYWEDRFGSVFAKKEFSQKSINILNKVKFWVIKEETNRKIVQSLFSELLSIWLPKKELKSKVDSLFVNQFDTSKKGIEFSIDEIIVEIEEIKKEAKKSSGYFDKERCKIEEQFDTISDALKNNMSPVWAPSQLSAISAQPDLLFYILGELKNKKIDDLRIWRDIWQIQTTPFSRSLFDIFRANLQTQENRRYILEFLQEKWSSLKRFYRHNFIVIEVVKTIDEILKHDGDLLEEIFLLAKELLENRDGQDLYIKDTNEDRWEVRDICAVMQKVHGKADQKLKSEITKYILRNFMIEENTDDSHSDSDSFFDIVSDWFKENVRNNFAELVEALSEQHEKLYQQIDKDLKFRGNDLFGGVTAFFGRNYRVSDKRFVTGILSTGLKTYYDKHKAEGWKFIEENCIIFDQEISGKKPDFLNRAILPIILERFSDKNKHISHEAFKILHEFIESKKGIPHKSDLIFQSMRDDKDCPIEKKWNLCKTTLQKNTMPLNVFVEDIVTEVALNNNDNSAKAKKAIEDWINIPEYFNRNRIFIRLFETINSYMTSDLDFAYKLFKAYLSSDSFKNKTDAIDTNEDVKIFSSFMRKDFEKTLNIWNNIACKDSLTKQEQYFISYCLTDFDSNDLDDNDKSLIKKINEEMVIPILNHLHNDLNLILKKFPCSHCRQEFVIFGELLAKIDLINDALNIINIFVKDPNPFLPGNDPEKSPYQDNEHNKILKGEKPIGIQSVRGWCCWVLMHCSVPKGRKYIPTILDHVERLTKDKNLYIKYMVCFTLSQLAKLRLSVLPDKRDILFFNDNPSVALAMAKRVESLAFNLLDYLAKESDNVQNAMIENVINIFSNMRELNESDSWKLLSTLSNLTPDAISKAAFLFIYYAEFRKTNFDKLRFSFPGFFNDLASSQCNERRFEKLILDVINKLDSEKREPFACQFYEIIKEIKSDSDENKRLFAISLKYLDCLSKDYNENLFQFIYKTILHSFKLDIESEKSLNLFKKCLAIEKEFISEPLTEKNKSVMYWLPAYENDDILEYIFKKFGEMEFLNCFTLLLTFPIGLNFDVPKSVRLLEKIDKQNKKAQRKAQRIVYQLFEERDPNRYHNLWLSWNENNLN